MSSNTQQTVPAGCTTGIFYLILAGLAFGISWQDLMDHASKHNLAVEYAAVYSKLGGWLRILDRQTFLRAFEVFSHAEIKGKPVLADSRNDQLPVMLRFPPPPLRQAMPISVQRTDPTLMTPLSPQTPFTNDYFSDFAPRYQAVAYMQPPPGEVQHQLYFAAPSTMVHMVPVYSFHLDGQTTAQQYVSYAQSQAQMETPVVWQGGCGSHGLSPDTKAKEAGSSSYISGSARRGSYSEISHIHHTTSKTRSKHRANTLNTLPNRSQSRTPVVVDGSCSSHGHKPRNSC